MEAQRVASTEGETTNLVKVVQQSLGVQKSRGLSNNPNAADS
jgi:hypothetical protein